MTVALAVQKLLGIALCVFALVSILMKVDTATSVCTMLFGAVNMVCAELESIRALLEEDEEK